MFLAGSVETMNHFAGSHCYGSADSIPPTTKSLVLADDVISTTCPLVQPSTSLLLQHHLSPIFATNSDRCRWI